MNGTLFAAIFCYAVWIVFGFVRPVGLGIIHLLVAIGTVLLIRWYAIRFPLRQS